MSFVFRFLRRCSIALFITWLGVAASVRAAEEGDAIDRTVTEYFRPYQFDLATLAPDGRHVAMAERVPGKAAATAVNVVDVEARSSRRYIVGAGAEHALLQLQWISPSRLVFTTRSRAVGVVDLDKTDPRPLLLARDFDAYLPEPMLGPRLHNVVVTPDMAADPTVFSPEPLEPRRQISVREVLQQAKVTGDLFGSDSTRESGRALRPYLLGLKPGAPNTVLIEVRTDIEVFRRGDRQQVTVPGNVIITERNAGPPDTPSAAGLDDGRQGEYASYNIDYLPPPLVVLELETTKGRVRELSRDDTWRRVLVDHQGRVRIALEQQGRRYRYLYRADDSKKWVPLDAITKTAAPLGFTVTAENLLAARSVPLGFDAGGKYLYIATNVGADTFGLRVLDPTNGQLTELEVVHPRYDVIEPTVLTAGDVLRFDPTTHSLAGIRFAAARRQTHWFDAGMKDLQAELNKKLAPHRCELREWNADRTRFVAEVSSPDDPGGFVFVDAVAGKIIRCGDRASWLTKEQRNPTHEFDFDTKDGRRYAGYLTLPRNPRLTPAPVLIYFHDGPWFAESPVFNRGAQALAALGFAVLQLNHRGSSGYGHEHLMAGKGALDRVVLEDIKAVLGRLGDGKLGINTKMVAALGNGVGGYLAVRMTQLAPEMFRCAVAINAPGDLDAWRTHPEAIQALQADLRKSFFGTDREALRAQSAVAVAPTTKAPVLVVHATGDVYVPISLGRELYYALKKGSEETAFLELPGAGHGGWSEETTAKLFAELGRFFNATIYNYGVKVQKAEVVK